MSSSNGSEKLRAVLLASLMFLWLFAGTVGFAGSAVAQTSANVTVDTAESSVTPNSVDADSSQSFTLSVKIDNVPDVSGEVLLEFSDFNINSNSEGLCLIA